VACFSQGNKLLLYPNSIEGLTWWPRVFCRPTAGQWLKWPGQSEDGGAEGGVGNLAHFERKRTLFLPWTIPYLWRIFNNIRMAHITAWGRLKPEHGAEPRHFNHCSVRSLYLWEGGFKVGTHILSTFCF